MRPVGYYGSDAEKHCSMRYPRGSTKWLDCVIQYHLDHMCQSIGLGQGPYVWRRNVYGGSDSIIEARKADTTARAERRGSPSAAGLNPPPGETLRERIRRLGGGG